MPFAAARQFLGKLTNRDLLEGVVAGALYVAAGDGLQAAEVGELKDTIAQNAKMAAFTHVDIDRCISTFVQVLQGGPRTARTRVKTEVEQATAGNPENQRVVFDAIFDIAHSNGLGEKEIPRLHEVCAWCGLNPAEEGLPALPA